jgi:prepilin-type N-terminal cleavage/methylation domain-containing protein
MRGARGFSLMEVMVAMVLLAAVGGTVMVAFTSSTQVVSSDTGVAYNFARGIMEQFQERVVTNWDAAGNPLALLPANRPAIPNNPKSLNGDTFTAAYTVNTNDGVTRIDNNGDGDEDFKRVNLTVTWP